MTSGILGCFCYVRALGTQTVNSRPSGEWDCQISILALSSLPWKSWCLPIPRQLSGFPATGPLHKSLTSPEIALLICCPLHFQGKLAHPSVSEQILLTEVNLCSSWLSVTVIKSMTRGNLGRQGFFFFSPPTGYNLSLREA